MDFSSLLSKEINKKRKINKITKTGNTGKKHHGKKLKQTKEEEEEEQTKGKEIIDIYEEPVSQPVLAREPKVSIREEGLCQEEIDAKLTQYNELDKSLTKNEKLKRLHFLLKLDLQNQKYADWVNKERCYYEDPEKQRIKLESVMNIESHRDELRVQIRVYLKTLINEWDKLKDKSDDDEYLLKETKTGIIKLLYKLRSDKLSNEMLISLSTIIYHLQANQFNKANESYLQLSIGNVCWPIGVVNVGIHARSASSKIAGTHSTSNIMVGESTRRWVISVKRLINFKEREYRVMPLSSNTIEQSEIVEQHTGKNHHGKKLKQTKEKEKEEEEEEEEERRSNIQERSTMERN
ncbi:hypothetical protein KGF56_003477 [Candida oxycetoniae]|uniref:Pre-mRNA-splicing factor 18 n=1 Tax=Candida oxycetoniae TaxID=497107 RepID=A0AAI9SVJ9_9ASCO|nr:uncharacterized protein KGF56_003477 [Candida oxycetoniae]KAI3403752.2 hypothetical protein KGF56_003477 [Candida oxycetoniae]